MVLLPEFSQTTYSHSLVHSQSGESPKKWRPGATRSTRERSYLVKGHWTEPETLNVPGLFPIRYKSILYPTLSAILLLCSCLVLLTTLQCCVVAACYGDKVAAGTKRPQLTVSLFLAERPRCEEKISPCSVLRSLQCTIHAFCLIVKSASLEGPLLYVVYVVQSTRQTWRALTLYRFLRVRDSTTTPQCTRGLPH